MGVDRSLKSYYNSNNNKQIDIMPWIQNVAFSDVQRGYHIDPGPNALLIQIMDPCMEFPIPKYTFKEIHQFEFLDVEEDGLTNNGDGAWTDVSEFAITVSQASELVRVLQHALAHNMNVIVHCVAGVCRSGAVAEVGVMMGFQDAEAYRQPNLLVKHQMMRSLGWTYDGEPRS